jgi:nucleoside-diphosphate-sugar epimerase
MTVYGDGSQTRSFQYVDDLVEGMFRLMESDYRGPVNIGNPSEYTVLQLAHLIQELTGTHSPVVYRSLPGDDPKQRRPDISLAKEIFDWEPLVPVAIGLARTVTYFRNEICKGDDPRADLVDGLLADTARAVWSAD